MKKTTGFWISFGGAIVLVIQALGNMFGFKVNSVYLNELITSICGVLVVVGILIPSSDQNSNESSDNQENIDTIDANNEDKQ